MKGMRVSKPGYDVRTATAEQRSFDSRWDSLKAKVFTTTTQTFTSGLTDQDFTFAHGLGYAPAFFVLVKVVVGGITKYAPLPYFNGNVGFPGGASRADTFLASTDTTDLRIRISGSAVGVDQSLEFKYYIFYNQLD